MENNSFKLNSRTEILQLNTYYSQSHARSENKKLKSRCYDRGLGRWTYRNVICRNRHGKGLRTENFERKKYIPELDKY